MATLPDIYKRLDEVSDRLSTRSRALALGLIAFFWTILTSNSELAKRFSQAFKSQLLGVAGLAILALLFDFLHYAVAYYYANNVRKEAEASTTHQAKYDYTHPLYRMQDVCFYMKQICVFLGSVGLLVLLFIQLSKD
ncbi:MAG TPA: hypothetical protein VNZ47_11345 [Candidatus Dormibacteraeota bacterium]|jgi:hypothetical protein|nr:hypothetical protein [Candidatus Dormibacteraeota bacterium]